MSYNKIKEPSVYVYNRKLSLDKIFVKLKNGLFGANTKEEYLLFYGRDYNTGEEVVEKVF